MDLGPLVGGRRKPVAFCVERRNGRQYDHLGAHLGALLQQHFVKSGWVTAAGEQYELTPAGEEALRRMGVSMEEPT